MKGHESAFPVLDATILNSDGSYCTDYACSDPGMTKYEYAAIHLKVPRSGDKELDNMIRQSRRAEFAGQALSKLVFPYGSLQHETDEFRLRVNQCFRFADAMLAEWEKEAGE
ncbi:MAG: hypothetical protein LBP76_06625 [Treponema sp.]|jgi:hypothetical protein|nr:hypothetical protein [Treponema sp.]